MVETHFAGPFHFTETMATRCYKNIQSCSTVLLVPFAMVANLQAKGHGQGGPFRTLAVPFDLGSATRDSLPSPEKMEKLPAKVAKFRPNMSKYVHIVSTCRCHPYLSRQMRLHSNEKTAISMAPDVKAMAALRLEVYAMVAKAVPKTTQETNLGAG